MRLILKIELALGAWLVVAPWALRFSAIVPALWSSVIAGSALILLALWGLYGASDGPPPNL